MKVAKIISRENFQLHPMDHNESGLSVKAELDGHTMTVHNVWENCGIIREVAECTCGHTSEQHPGGGCWQYSHNKPQTHNFDGIHQRLYDGIKQPYTPLPIY